MRPVVVAGGGVAGATTAIALTQRGVPCLVLERSSACDRCDPIGECLAPSAAASLAELGVWEEFVQQGHRPSHANVSLWAGEAPTVHNFVLEPYGNGWFLDRAKLDTWLLAVAERRGAKVHRGVKIGGCRRVADGIALELESGGHRHTLETDMVVDATGPTARIARQLGARRLDHDRLVAWALRQRASTRDEQDVLLIEPAQDGWWYAAPLPDGDVVAVFVAEASTVVGTAEVLQERLQATTAIAARCAGRRLVGTPRPHRLIVGRLDRFAGDGWLAVGDAALSRDPLAAVGIVSALEGGIAAAEAIASGRIADHGRDLDTAFEEHLEVRAALHRAQTRWSTSSFWRRRAVVLDEPITLHPAEQLGIAGALPREIPTDLGTQLCPQEWRRLHDIEGVVSAADLARRIAPRVDRHAGDRRVIGVLQRLVRTGLLRVA